jgi:Zn-dependent metalloprotease
MVRQEERDLLLDEVDSIERTRYDARNRLRMLEAQRIASIDPSDWSGSAKDLIQHLAPLLGLDGNEVFELTGRQQVSNGKLILQIDQYHAGLPVLGSRITLRVSKASGEVERLESTATSMRSSVTTASIEFERAKGIIANHLSYTGVMASASDPTLAYFVRDGSEPILVWNVTTAGGSADQPARRILVDASDGTIVATFDRARHALDRTLWSQNF